MSSISACYSMNHTERPVVIVGGGIIGLATAWELLRYGKQVTIVEKGRVGRGASYAAAGMLAADAEVGFEELELYQLHVESMRRWPHFARALQEETGVDVDYRSEGTLLVADDRDSAEALRRRYRFQKEHGMDATWMSAAEMLDVEPFLSPRLVAGVFTRADHGVDNRKVLEALRKGILDRRGRLRELTAVRAVKPSRTHPAVVLASGEHVEAESIVLAMGAWAREIEGLPEDDRPPVRPVKGQMIELKAVSPFELKHVVRGPRAYVAPKSDGRVFVGATSEELGFDLNVTAGGLFTILEGAWEIVPGIYDLPVIDAYAGLRPASRDHAPLLGLSRAPGVVIATGHFRHGIMMTPVTAQEVARLVVSGETSHWLAPFSPQRFNSKNRTVGPAA